MTYKNHTLHYIFLPIISGLSSQYWWGVWHCVFGRHQPSLDGIIRSLKHFWEFPSSTSHLSKSNRSSKWGRGSHVSTQVKSYFNWIYIWFFFVTLISRFFCLFVNIVCNCNFLAFIKEKTIFPSCDNRTKFFFILLLHYFFFLIKKKMM